MVWMPRMCQEHCGVLCTPPCQIDAELNGRNYPVRHRLSSFHTVSLECPLHLDHTGIFHLFKEMYAFHPPAQYFVST